MCHLPTTAISELKGHSYRQALRLPQAGIPGEDLSPSPFGRGPGAYVRKPPSGAPPGYPVASPYALPSTAYLLPTTYWLLLTI